MYDSDDNVSDNESSYSSDTSSGSSGDGGDLPEDDAEGYDSDISNDSERTILTIIRQLHLAVQRI